MDTIKWSYSAHKQFDTCPKQYHHMRVLRDVVEPETDAQRYGTRFHEAAELYGRDGVDLPVEFRYAKAALDALLRKPGEKLFEYEMGLTADLKPCKIKSPDAWFRGIADFVSIDGDRAWVVDYKTGSNTRYADTGQLELMAMSLMKHFPKVQTVSTALLFVVANKLIPLKVVRADEMSLWGKWMSRYSALETAYQTDVWNPRPSGICKRHCSVMDCIHNGRNR